MRLEYQVLIAVGLDLLLGDPSWLPHPVKIIGGTATRLESPLRRYVRNARFAGILMAALTLCVTGACVWVLLLGAGSIHAYLRDAVSILILYTCIAARDLARHSFRVYRALADGDIEEARRRVSMLVGRDTENLSESEIVRAAVESVAENLVDGVTAPLFFASIGGPVAAMLYKAANTLDSTFGYKNERYIQFGWASARFDDLVNYLPARLTAPFVSLAALLLGLNARDSLRILFRDGKKHSSPNSGLTEAAVAGAIGVQLGGRNYYFGQPSDRPRLGEPKRIPERAQILQVNSLMFATTALTLTLFIGVRLCVTGAWR